MAHGCHPRPTRRRTAIDTIIFDFGNVIGFFDHNRAARNLARYSSLSPEDILRHLFGGSLEDDYESGRISSTEFLARVRTTCRLNGSDEELTEAYVSMFWPNPAVCELIPRLARRYRLLLGSNTTELHSTHFRHHFADTLRHFHALVLSHDVGARKPHPRFYAHCHERAGRSPEACLFIDDLPDNVAGAVHSGLNALLYHPRAELSLLLRGHGMALQ